MPTVEENAELDRARDFALAAANHAIRALAANLIRVAAGAGKPHFILDQAVDLLIAARDYAAAAPIGPISDYLAEALDLREELAGRGLSGKEFDWQHGEQQVLRGALRLAAGRLLGQKTQEAAGHHQMFEGITLIEKVREQNRKERDRRAPVRSSRKRTKPIVL